MYRYPPIKKQISLTEIITYLPESQIIGSDKILIAGLCSTTEPLEGHLAYIEGDNQRKVSSEIDNLNQTGVSAVIINSKIEVQQPDKLTVIKNNDPRKAFFSLLKLFFNLTPKTSGKIHPTAIIATDCEIDPTVDIDAYVVIGDRVKIAAGTKIFPHTVIHDDVSIGQNCSIHAHATIREGVIIGNYCIIQSGSVIGGDGFGYTLDPAIGLSLVPQLGTVILEDRVEVGALTTIDRATLGTTKIAAGTKIDNLVQVGHNVKIGRNSIICAQAGIAGSTTLGDQVTLGGKAGIADHLQIASGVRIGAASSAISSIEKEGDYLGFPAIPGKQWRRQEVVITRITNSFSKLRKLLGDKDES
jgi:UDP-3-O-[3-hydroxymyristoyl] glucosamine N-acyltransferase